MHSWLKTKKPREHEKKEKNKNSMNSMHSWLTNIKPRENEKKEKNRKSQ